MSEQTIKIAIAEDHAMVRQGFVRALADLKNFQVMVEAGSGPELLTALTANHIDLVILDMVMPGMDGREVIEKIKSLNPQIKILVVSAQDDHNLIAKYVKLGACGFLAKTGDIFELLKAVSQIMASGSYFQDEILEMLAQKGINNIGGSKQLTAIEMKILKLLCQNRPYSEISSELGIGKSEVGYYRTRILHKTTTSDVEELRIYAKNNLLM